MNLPSLEAAVLIVGIGLLIVALAFVWWWVPKWQANSLRLKIRDPKARADIEDNFRKTLSQLFGGVAVLLGAAFAYYQSQLTAKASSDLLISQQISKGFEQLGNEGNIVIRLGGIYALEGVMNTSLDYHNPVMEALLAFIRYKTSGVREKPAAEKKPGPGLVMDENPFPTDVQAALTVLGRRVRRPREVVINLAKTELIGANLFLAKLDNAFLVGANTTWALQVRPRNLHLLADGGRKRW